jgi:hypothetical protein
MDQKSSKLDNDVIDKNVNNDALTGSRDITAYSSTQENNYIEERDTDVNLESSSDEPEEIKAQIEETRSQMSETINAIEEKFNFSKISEQVKEGVSEQITNALDTAKDAVYDATIGKAENIMQSVSKGFSDNFGDAGSYVVKSAKGNPLPLALIGIGIGMLFMQRNRSRSHDYDYKTNDYRRNYAAGEYNQTNQNKTMDRQASSNTGGVLGSAQETVSNVASSAYGGVSSLASKTGEQAVNLGSQVQKVARQTHSQYEQTLKENPLIVGAVALALGAAVGLTIPETEYENQWMGESKENLVQSVEGVARDAFTKVQEVAGEVTKTVKEQTQS